MTVTLAEARAAGRKYYRTNRPCKNGHVADRYTATKQCTACYRLTAAEDAKPGPRALAKARGAPRYRTGRPCKRGHRVERYTGSGQCVACHAAAMRRPEARLKRRARLAVHQLEPASVEVPLEALSDLARLQQRLACGPRASLAADQQALLAKYEGLSQAAQRVVLARAAKRKTFNDVDVSAAQAAVRAKRKPAR